MAVYRDAEHIKSLTKQDLIEFMATTISPKSPGRAKTSIHLIARASAENAAADIKMTEQSGELAQAERILAQGQVVPTQLLPDLSVKAQQPTRPDDGAVIHGDTNRREKNQTIFIKDFEAFKATLRLTAGSRVMKPISDFRDTEQKL
jgi:hypothetical protein